jgi:hypothetical protein
VHLKEMKIIFETAIVAILFLSFDSAAALTAQEYESRIVIYGFNGQS